MKKEFVKLSAVLCLITLVAALVLAGVNFITAPVIEKAEIQASKDAMFKILPEADDFIDSDTDENLKVAVKDDTIIGFCAKVTTTGYGGDIVMMIGVDENLIVQGIEVLSHSETAGLGAKITEEKFKNQFKDKLLVGLKVVKGKTQSPDEFEAVTGATISSRAVETGINLAKEMIEREVGAK